MKFFSVQSKLLAFFFILIASLLAIDILIQYNNNYLISLVNETFDTINTINRTKQDINILNSNIQRYLVAGDSDSMLAVYGCINSIDEKLSMLENKILGKEEYLYYTNLSAIFEYLSKLVEKLVIYKKGNLPLAKVYSEYLDFSGFFKEYLEKFSEQKVKFTMEIHIKVQQQLNTIRKINIAVILIWTLFASLLSIVFSSTFTTPIINLSKVANKIAHGNLEVQLPSYSANDEVAILYNSFSNMISNIKEMVKKLEEKADLERMYAQQKIEAIKYKQALQEAELKNLQAQINPHFLFNTLNTILQIAMFENAKQTYEILLRTSNYLRYVVHNINRVVKLQEEIDNVKNYMYIYSMRFGDRIRLEIEIEEELKDLLVPCMILQPLVENAIIHGFKEKECGEIKVNAKKIQDQAVIEVVDNGQGIDIETIENLKNSSFEKNKTTGIGLSNIAKRLSFFYNIQNPLSIEANPQGGTKVTIKVPFITEISQLPKQEVDTI
ncbi:signal transduction histidine kinase, LytS [Caldicellulosiruptor acetigenus I77R1B]|uniref:histidine kinase n=1 Tax=Caldicellulosiruptor acetigenus (strain ATCC 700853 / DSM 12137 / I77R1B) TaxID=632335 RepID=E4S7X2_CALA7|nr:histidine kinase [Caldicellulosiruptor acetigenus]ADQ41872.1 signal transduction histidine kinase, LytS [Caldicellulosiruptor acetigenus I77R1B]